MTRWARSPGSSYDEPGINIRASQRQAGMFRSLEGASTACQSTGCHYIASSLTWLPVARFIQELGLELGFRRVSQLCTLRMFLSMHPQCFHMLLMGMWPSRSKMSILKLACSMRKQHWQMSKVESCLLSIGPATNVLIIEHGEGGCAGRNARA